MRQRLQLVRDRIVSDRGSVYLEYALVGTLVFVGAVSAFAPGSVINEALGSDWAFREILIKLPIF
jgi:hypothetical protein